MRRFVDDLRCYVAPAARREPVEDLWRWNVAIFDRSMKRLESVLEHATFNLSILSEDSIRPALWAQLERDLAIAVAAARSKGHSAEVDALLRGAWTDVGQAQLQRWQALIVRLTGDSVGGQAHDDARAGAAGPPPETPWWQDAPSP